MVETGSGRAGGYHFALVVEQNLGHRTHYRNLKRYVPLDPDVRADWLPIEYDEPSSLARALGSLGTNMTVRSSFKAWRAVRASSRNAPLDAVFYHTQTTALLGPHLMRTPAVVSLDATPINLDSLAEHYNHSVGGPFEGLKRRLHASVFRSACALVTWSQWAKDSLERDYGIPAEKITVVQPGVDLGDWPSGAREHANGGPHLPRLLFVGGDFARKGGETLLQAFRERLDQRCELHVVTQASLEPGHNLHVHKGITPDNPLLRQLYAEADVFVFPTQADCLAQVIPEAMAAGLPVVTTRVGATPEVVSHGVTGLMVKPKDVVGLARAVEDLLDHPDLRRAMGEAGRRRVEEVCDARKNASRIVDLLKKVSVAPRDRAGVPAP
jgi:glycosyltransferase involved in cell wall biosynthesis